MTQDQDSEGRYTYIHFDLNTPRLEAECISQLKMLGLECLEEGSPYEAWGIIRLYKDCLKRIRRIPGIKSIDAKASPFFL